MSKVEFNPQLISYDLRNAYFLARLSELVYEPLDSIAPTLVKEYGLTKYVPFEDKSIDTQAFLASNQDVMVVAFRGTTNWQDWMTNFKIVMTPSSVGKVHSGFKCSLDSIWKDLYDAVMSGKERNQKLWFTGHSLGGALATLAVDRFSEENVELANGMYTFGQPRVGDKVFAENFDRKVKNAFRFVDDEDVVTKIPIPPGYKHVGQEYFFNNKGELLKNNLLWEWVRSMSNSVAIRSSEDAHKFRSQNPGGINDHGAAYYVRYLYQNMIKKGSTFKEYINKD